MARKTFRQDDWVWGAVGNISLWHNLLEKGISHNMAGMLVKNKWVLVNGKKCDSHTILTAGDEIRIQMLKEKIDYEPVSMDLKILFENQDILVLDKPRGITVNSKGQISLANGIAYYFKEQGIKRKIRFVNRLDRDTSGCIMIAKSALAQSIYQKQLEKGILKKWYETIVEGILEGEAELILPMGKSADAIHYEVQDGGKMTVTHYCAKGRPSVEKLAHIGHQYGPMFTIDVPQTLVEVELLTGKTHQIRIALAHIGHPLRGDVFYGSSFVEDESFYLRAKKLSFVDMRNEEDIIIEV